ncbi:hydantoinase B/oxoprolinase family protein [Actinomadura madurae]|uniref:hydantoinase B/oxoprolinase family protein n=1 Tax=Actinomadura madurae TaxID=1993 RepID=UPI0020D1FF56|nr:hydantoinase B/oxoprolinase family protein [Actinomadura madurae]
MTSTQPEMPEGFDPVTLEVIRMRLDSIVEEMGIAMIRSSGSPVITEAGDFNTALFDPAGPHLRLLRLRPVPHRIRQRRRAEPGEGHRGRAARAG